MGIGDEHGQAQLTAKARAPFRLNWRSVLRESCDIERSEIDPKQNRLKCEKLRTSQDRAEIEKVFVRSVQYHIQTTNIYFNLASH